MSDINNVTEEIKRHANWADRQVKRNRYWRERDIKRRKYEIMEELGVPPWEMFTKEIGEKAEKRYEEDINIQHPGTSIRIDGKKIHLKELEKINRHLPEGYFYSYEKGSYEKREFLLGEIEEHKKINEIDEFIIGNELVCNHKPFEEAYFVPISNLIVGRTKPSEGRIWANVLTLKNKEDEPENYFRSKGLKLLGLEKEDIKKEPEEIAEKVEEISRKCLNATLKHEEGHYQVNKDFPCMAIDFGRSLDIARKHKNEELEDFIRDVNDCLADTIETERIKGKYPYLIGEDEIDILYLILDNTFLKENRFKIDYDMFLALPEYEKTGNKKILKKANEKTFNKATKLKNEIIRISRQDESEIYPQLIESKKKFDKKHKKKYEEEIGKLYQN